MKKVLFLLLLVTSISYGQALFDKGIKIPNNVTSTTATKVNVQESNGLINTIAKADLIEVLEYSTASAMPVTGVSGKIYVTIDSGRLYRWNGTVYNEISTGGVTSVSGLNGVTITNPTTTPIIGLSDITPATVTANSLTLTPVTAPSYVEGKVFYDSSAKTLVAYDDISGTSTNLGQELNLRARNNTGVTITNGSVVYISGATGQNPTIALARANSLLTSVTIGIATHDISNNTIGKITTFGLVNDLNTSAFTDGQVLYLSPTTAGTLTATVPSSPNYTAHVCVVLHSHITQGKIFVRPEQPISLNTALTDNNNTSPSVSAVKSYIDTGLSSKISGSGTIGTLPIFTNAGVLGNSGITQSNGLFGIGKAVVSNTKIGIDITGTTASLGLDVTSGNSGVIFRDPLGGLQIGNNGVDGLISYGGRGLKIRTQGSTNPMTFEVNTSEKLRINNNGNVLIGTAIDNGIDQLQIPNGTISAQPATLSDQVVVKSQLDLKANIASPTFTGVPSVPTAAAGTNTTQIASTAFVETSYAKLSGAAFTGNTSLRKTFLSAPSGSGYGLYVDNFVSEIGIGGRNFSGGTFLNIEQTGSGKGIVITNDNIGIEILNRNSGISTVWNKQIAATGDFLQIKNNGTTISNINYLGELTSPKITMTGTIDLKSYTVATLPTGIQGATAYVTDATSPAYLGSLTGGGTVKCPVFFNGTIWVSH